MKLTDSEKRDIVEHIEKGVPLPDKYRFLLFENRRQVELLWNGKSGESTNVVLPFQIIEQVDEPRSETSKIDQFNLFDTSGRQIKGWTNKLIWGDNKYILSSLKNGPLRKEIEDNGGIKLIYIDPPFDVGADFTMNVEIGDGESYEKQPNILEQLAYRDTWGLGQDSFLSMIYERLLLMRDLLSDDGSIYVHCDWRVNSSLRLIMDEIFGKNNYWNEIIWCYTGASNSKKEFPRKHDCILRYSKSDKIIFNPDSIRIPYSEKTISNYDIGTKGSGFVGNNEREVLTESILKEGKIPEDYWNFAISARFPIDGIKRVGYPTEKPLMLIERIIKASSNENDIVCDFFSGGGTTPTVCEFLNRKWICSDLGKFSIHTTRKRLIGVQRELKSSGKDYRPFELLNLGKYQREHFIFDGKDERNEIKKRRRQEQEKQFEELILSAYKSEKVSGFRTFQGKKNFRMISIGPINQPVSRLHIEEVIKECLDNRITKVDILGFEYEMGLFPTIQDEASSKGIDLQYKQIPNEVFDKRAVEKGEVRFYDVSYIEVKPIIKGNFLSVELIDFATFYNLDNEDKVEDKLKSGKSTTIVSNGQILKVSKDKNGIIEKEIITKKWSDWVDYWSVDFDFKKRKETIRVLNEQTDEWEEKWTGDYIFDNEWQSFRTKNDRELELVSTPKEINVEKVQVAVKVVDIFGNDTMKIFDVKIK